jgi:glycosyltransferase involved in cell wall biosynthesis
MKQLPLSVIILTSGKDEFLQKAKNSAAQAMEVLVYDLSEKVVTDFAQVRNQALQQAQYNWVFFLDSDEVITQQSWSEIEEIINYDQSVLVKVKRQDLFLGKELKFGEVGNMSLVRMGKKKDVIWQRPVHEVLESKGGKNIPEIESSIEIRHQAHQNLSHFMDKVAKYALIEAKYRAKHGQSFKASKMIIWPLGKFIYNYLFKLGFLDGWRGLIYAVMMSLHSFWVRVNLYEITTK